VALVAAGTDWQINNFGLGGCPEVALILVLLQFYTKTWDNSMWVDLRWRPRGTNTEADQLTNGDFSGFDNNRRVQIMYRDLDVLQTELAAFEDTVSD